MTTEQALPVSLCAARKTLAGAQDLLDQIARMLDGGDWSPDTLNQIAEHMRAAGYLIREPEEEPGPQSTSRRYFPSKSNRSKEGARNE